MQTSPRPSQLAKWLVERSTDEAQEPEPEAPTAQPAAPSPDLRAYLATIDRKRGQIFGKRRLKTMDQGTAQQSGRQSR